MRTPRPALLATIVALGLLVACGGRDESSPTATTTAGGPSTGGSTTSPTQSSGVAIVALTGPPSPVQCDAPTSVDIHFDARHAQSVALRINGGAVYTTYSGGKHTEEVPLACDGTPQTYQLTARAANGETATKSLTLETRVST